MRRRIAWAVLVVLCSVGAGCGNDFDEDKMRQATEQGPVHIDSEQVSMTNREVACGVDRELWDAPVQVSDRSVARLRQPARDLGFSDDVSIGDPGYVLPYSQMRGDFMLRVETMIDVKDGPARNNKTVLARIRVKVPHECFEGDLPIMGIRKGQFRQELPVILVFALEGDGWHLDHFVH
jgi:hypothetical protein